MEAKAYLKYARISPRKVKIVLDLIRGKDVGMAMATSRTPIRVLANTLSSCWEVQSQMRKTISTWIHLNSTFPSAS